MIKLTQVVTNLPTDDRYLLKEVVVNPSSISCISPLQVDKDSLPEGLDDRVEFSTLAFNVPLSTGIMVVVGSPAAIQERIRSSRSLLKG